MTRPFDTTRTPESSRSPGGDGAAASRTPGGDGAAGPNPVPAGPTPIPATRQPLPGPPAGGRPAGGGYQPPRYAPRPRRRLSAAQGSRLGLIAAVIVLVGAAIGLSVTLVLPTEYAARTVIEYHVSQENASSFLRTDRNLTTQVVLLTSRAILGPVADANSISPDRLAEKVTATNLANSELIQVDVLDRNREIGVRLADAIGRRFLEVSETGGLRGEVQERLDEARRDLALAPTGSPGSVAATTRAEIVSRISTLESQLDTIAITGNRARLAVPAYSVAAPAAPRPGLAAATGALLGVVVAGLVAIALSRRWTRS